MADIRNEILNGCMTKDLVTGDMGIEPMLDGILSKVRDTDNLDYMVAKIIIISMLDNIVTTKLAEAATSTMQVALRNDGTEHLQCFHVKCEVEDFFSGTNIKDAFVIGSVEDVVVLNMLGIGPTLAPDRFLYTHKLENNDVKFLVLPNSLRRGLIFGYTDRHSGDRILHELIINDGALILESESESD